MSRAPASQLEPYLLRRSSRVIPLAPSLRRGRGPTSGARDEERGRNGITGWIPDRGYRVWRTGRLNHLRQRAIAGRVPVSIHSVPRERDASFALHRRPMPISSWWGHVPKGRPQLPAKPRAMLDLSPCAVLVAWRAGYYRKACGVRQCNAVLIGRCRTMSADARRSNYQGRPRAEDSGSGSRSSTAYTTTGC